MHVCSVSIVSAKAARGGESALSTQLLMNKVTGLLRGGGRSNDGSRVLGKDKGRTVITVRSPEATDAAGAAVHPPVHCCLLTFTDRNNFAVEWIDYLPSQPMLAPSQRPSVCLCAPVVNFITMWQSSLS